MLKGIRCIKDRLGIIGEIRENTGIVSVEARNGSGDFELIKILFKYVVVFNYRIKYLKCDLNS